MDFGVAENQPLLRLKLIINAIREGSSFKEPLNHVKCVTNYNLNENRIKTLKTARKMVQKCDLQDSNKFDQIVKVGF